MAVEIARTDLTPAQLRAAAGKTKDGRAARRMLAIALVLEGMDRTTAAKTGGMDRQTLRDWVHRYNAEGLAGLDLPPFSRPAGAVVAGPEGRARRAGGGGPRSGAGRGGAVAPHRPEAAD